VGKPSVSDIRAAAETAGDCVRRALAALLYMRHMQNAPKGSPEHDEHTIGECWEEALGLLGKASEYTGCILRDTEGAPDASP